MFPFPRLGLAVTALVAAVVLISGSIGSALAASGPPIAVPVGQTVQVHLSDGNVIPVTVVRPGIAVFAGEHRFTTNALTGTYVADSDPDPFTSRIRTILGEIASNPVGRKLVYSFSGLSPLPDAPGSTGQYQFLDDAGRPYAINLVVSRSAGRGAYAQTPYFAWGMNPPRTANGRGTVAFLEVRPDVLVTMPNASGAATTVSPDSAVFHELVHAAHALAGSETDGESAHTMFDTQTQTWQTVMVANEELLTHGGLEELASANGVTTGPDGSVTINSSPQADASIETATWQVGSDRTAIALHGSTPGREAALVRSQRTLAARTGVVDLTERDYVTSRGLDFPPDYAHRFPDGQALDYQLVFPDDIGPYLTALRADPSIQDDPTRSGLSFRRVDSMEGARCAGNARFACGVTAERPASEDEAAAGEKLRKSIAKRDVAAESAAEDVVGRLSPTELSDYAAARVSGEDVSFTNDLGEAWKTGKVFVPTGRSTASKLVEGWRFGNSAGMGAGVILWIEGLVESFQSDSTDLDKATAALALVPAVGQILGIVDGLQHHDPVFVVSNVTALLSFALEFCEQPELAMVFGVASLVTAIVDVFLNFDENDPRYQSYASWNIEGRRDAAWRTNVAKGLVEKTIPALVTAADAAYQRAQREILFSSDVAQAVIDAGVADADLAARNAAVGQKAQIRAAAQGSLDSLRSGFVSGSQGVAAAIRNAAVKLNDGVGFGEFTHDYLQTMERPDYVLAMYTGCRNGDSQTDDVPDAAQMLACSDRKPYYGEHFDSVVEPQIQASESPGGLVVATYAAAVDAEIQKQDAFVEFQVADTDPTLKVTGRAASITSALGGACLQRNGKGGQVATRAAGQCESLGWTVNPDHTITARDGLCLDAAGAGTAPGTPAVTWDCTGRPNQRWTLNPNGTITGDQSGLCLDITDSRTPNGVVELWSCNGDANQRWSYRATPYPYSLISAINGAGRLAATVGDGVGLSPADGTSADEQWTYVADSSAGRLMNAYGGTCLQASATTAALAECKPGDTDQQWMLILSNTGEGFQIRNMTRGVCLTTGVTLGACTTDATWRMTPNLTAIPGPHVRIPTPGAE